MRLGQNDAELTWIAYQELLAPCFTEGRMGNFWTTNHTNHTNDTNL